MYDSKEQIKEMVRSESLRRQHELWLAEQVELQEKAEKEQNSCGRE